MTWLIVALAVLLLPARALAETKSVQVLAILSEDAFAESKALTMALKQAVRETEGFKLAPGEHSLEVLLLALNCKAPPGQDCVKRISKEIGNENIIWGTLSRDGKELLAHLRYFSQGRTQRQTTVQYRAGLTDPLDPTLRNYAKSAISKLLLDPNRKKPNRGMLYITAGDITGDLLINGKPHGRVKKGYAEASLPEGDHVITIRAAGYNEIKSEATVVAGRSSDLLLTPVRQTEGPRETTVADEGGGIGTGQTLGFIALGSGALFVGGGVYSMLQVKSVNDDAGFNNYRAGLTTDQNACDEARAGTAVSGAPAPSSITDKCDKAALFETLQYVFLGLGGAAITTGTILLLASDSDDSSTKGSSSKHSNQALRIKPRIGVTSQGALVDLSVRF